MNQLRLFYVRACTPFLLAFPFLLIADDGKGGEGLGFYENTASAVAEYNDFELEKKQGSYWGIQGGVALRRVGNTVFRGGVGPASALSNPFVSSGAVLPSGVGSASEFDDRQYDDGFVKIGSGTLANGPGAGYTTNWGYQTAGQLQGPHSDGFSWESLVLTAGGGTESIASTTTTTEQSSYHNSGKETEIMPFIELSYFRQDRDDPRKEIGLTLGFSWIKSAASSPWRKTSQSNYELKHYELSVVDTYALNGVIPPPAPYSGAFNPPGPLIQNIPVDRATTQSLTDTQTLTDVTHARETIDFNLQTLSLGVVWRKIKDDLNATSETLKTIDALMPNGSRQEAGSKERKRAWQIEGGLAINRIEMRWTQEQVMTRTPGALTGASILGAGDTQVKLGAYAASALHIQLNEEKEDWFINLKARYDWAGKESIGNASNRAEIDLSGWSLAIGFEYLF